MPLLEINQNRHICASVRLDEVTAAKVDQYAAFIHASADDVVDKALNYVFSKDRDFQEFLKTPQAKQVATTLRVRKAASNGGAEEPARKVVAGVESTTSVRAVKA
jgi:hypothetical protein